MSACRITRSGVIVGEILPRYAPQPMSEAATSGSESGPAAGVRWDLSHLYAGPDDPRIDGDLDAARTAAKEFAERWRGRIALSGGVFQNAILLEAVAARLQATGHRILSHSRVPTNDGGLSLGQAAVAAARLLNNGQ